MVASKPANVVKQTARVTTDIDILLVAMRIDHGRSVAAAIVWLVPKGLSWVATVIPTPSLVFIPFPPGRSVAPAVVQIAGNMLNHVISIRSWSLTFGYAMLLILFELLPK